ncbi:type II toxin-antitoxin system RatA family toxin [Aestuariivirga sp.]|uniref:type II toxin-antitoxin system RatA family toxin n=1 Tax=Aestuariivirga sp. TaxID=2650926 RepID=UPI0039E2C4ED
MSTFKVSRHVPYTVDQIFEVASNVGHYNQFIPLVKKSIITNAQDLPDGRRSFMADLHFAYKKLGISDVLRSHVTVDPATHSVKATSNEGPVKSLVSEWRITPGANGGSDITFMVDYTLKSRSLQFLLSGMFDLAVRKIMNAFEERAKKLYGSPAAA